MPAVIGKMIRGWFVAPDSGLCYHINLINMGDHGNDLDKIHTEVNRVNGLVAGNAASCMATVGLLLPVWQAAAAELASITNIIGSKTRPFVYLPKRVADPENTRLPSGFFEKMFVWNGSDNEVWSYFDSNGLGYRFAFVHSEAEIPGHDAPPVVTPPVVVPSVSATTEQDLRLKCLDLALDLYLQNNPNNVELTEAPILSTARNFVKYVKEDLDGGA